MQTNNPFDVVLNKLEQLQTTVNLISVKAAMKRKQPEARDRNRILSSPKLQKSYVNQSEGHEVTSIPNGYPRSDWQKLTGKVQRVMQWFEAFSSDSSTKIEGTASGKMQALRVY